MVRDQISPPGDKISAVTDGVSRFVIPPARVYEALVVANAAMVLSGHGSRVTPPIGASHRACDITADEAVADIIPPHRWAQRILDISSAVCACKSLRSGATRTSQVFPAGMRFVGVIGEPGRVSIEEYAECLEFHGAVGAALTTFMIRRFP
jgi:hypothetical protein